eukprot:TRINITY_DN3950_c0_g1_i2.p3 TRINITY_DN3950_c0_g1~~TRINITY_DN3950_c0_g1_i2.p3  ORF type:complete len:151 (-),score=20.30 TRINITY_DN3950_c0_g1_i2:102-554(-)
MAYVWDNSTKQLQCITDSLQMTTMSPQGKIWMAVSNPTTSISTSTFFNASTLAQAPMLRSSCPYGDGFCDNSTLYGLKPVQSQYSLLASGDGHLVVSVSSTRFWIYNRTSSEFVDLFSSPGVPFSGVINLNIGFSTPCAGSFLVLPNVAF